MGTTKQAIKKELQQMIDKNVWEPVHRQDLRHDAKILPSMMFMKEKTRPDGTFDKLKARIVAGGHRQDKFKYSNEQISSPTAATKSLFMVAAIAAADGREIVTGDVPGAYLHAEIKEEIYMIINKEVADILTEMDEKYIPYLYDGKIIVKLCKALYGCVESARLWYEHLRQHLANMGFSVNATDMCVFNKGDLKNQQTIIIYVDDILITSISNIELEETIKNIEKTFNGIQWTKGNIHNYLGMTLIFDKEFKRVGIKMDNYIQELLLKYNTEGHSKTPCGVDLFNISESSAPLDDKDKETYHSAVASALFLAKRSRPDLLLTISFLATRVMQPTEQDMNKLMKLFKYINGTRNIHLFIDANTYLEPWISIDSSFGSHSDGKGHTGSIEGIGNGGVEHMSKKQKIVCKSSMESEIVGLSDALTNAVSTRNFLKMQGYTLGPTKILHDNKAAITTMTNGGVNLNRSKHINIRNFWVKELIDNKEFEFHFVPSELMIADLLTKPIVGKRFIKLRAELLNIEIDRKKSKKTL